MDWKEYPKNKPKLYGHYRVLIDSPFADGKPRVDVRYLHPSVVNMDVMAFLDDSPPSSFWRESSLEKREKAQYYCYCGALLKSNKVHASSNFYAFCVDRLCSAHSAELESEEMAFQSICNPKLTKSGEENEK